MGIKEFRLENLNNLKIETQGIPHNAGITVEKAKEILSDGSIGGRHLTSAQKGFFGSRAGGASIKRG
ncbi:hypothetical protein LCGC14_1294830 [marine sediment metagenome]|uniref:Uncharacterized protein n=1 Tax=marine sediment metagenome TaxID=412755 RepID=A0A0F9KT42_9ZZZZ